MKLAAGWIGVAFVLGSFLLQLLVIMQQKNQIKLFIIAQAILFFSAIFWMIYAFLDQPIYWPTGINNVLVFLFNFIFLMINYSKWKKQKVVS